MNKTVIVLLISLASIPASSHLAYANIWDHFEHWVHKEYNEVRHQEKKLEKKAEDSAKYIAKKTAHEANILAHEAQDLAKQAVNYFEKYALSSFLGHCANSDPIDFSFNDIKPKPMRDLAKEIRHHIPKIHIDGMPKSLDFLVNPDDIEAYPSCRANMAIGFNCGAFPYIKGIISDIKTVGNFTLKSGAEVAHASNRASQMVAKAYNSDVCNAYNLAERGSCAVISAAVDESKLGISKLTGVIIATAKNPNLSNSINSNSKKISSHDLAKHRNQLCYDAGTFAFGTSVDVLLDQEERTSVRRLNQLRKMVKNTAKIILGVDKLKKINDEKIDGMINTGFTYAKQDIKNGRVQSAKILTLSPHKKPNKDIKLMARLDKDTPMCLDLAQGDINRSTLSYPCHGQANQRWSFQDTGKTHDVKILKNDYKRAALNKMNQDQLAKFEKFKDFKEAHEFLTSKDVRALVKYKGDIHILKSPIYTIMNGVKGSNGNVCLALNPKKFPKGIKYHHVKACDSNDAFQQFIVTEYGALKNLHSGRCVDYVAKGHSQSTHDAECQPNERNQKLYYTDPSLSLLKGNPGPNSQLWAFPDKPFCFDFKEKSPHSTEAFTCNDTKWQSLSFIKKANDYFQIKSDKTDLCVDSMGDRGRHEALIQFDCQDGNANQLFKVTKGGHLQNKANGYCISIPKSLQGGIWNAPCGGKYKHLQHWHVFSNKAQGH